MQKLRAVVEACNAWGVRLLVLPEYSVPVGALSAIARAAGDMVVVAGSCFVDASVRKSPVYDELHAPRKPELRWNVAHVVRRRHIVALVPKLHATPEEQRLEMTPATEWAPVDLSDDFGGPLGVLICLDFLERTSETFCAHVGPKLDQCRALAVPALTSEGSRRFFEAHQVVESGPGRRPVLFANHPPGGGSTIVTGERTMEEARDFPVHAGVLDKGEEGVLVVDLDLAVVGVGQGGRYEEALPCVPIAAASLVYTGTTPEAAQWLSELREVLPETPSDEAEAYVLDRAIEWLNGHPPPRANAFPTPKRRWDRMLGTLAQETSVESLRRLTREVVLPPEVLPLDAVEDALASGAAREIQRWTLGAYEGAASFATVAATLSAHAHRAEARRVAWADRARRAWAGIADAAYGLPGQVPRAIVTPLDRATETVENQVVKKALDEGNALAAEGRIAEARAAFERALAEAERQGEANLVHGDTWRVWVARAAIGAATCSANLQDLKRARDFLDRMPADALDARRRVRVANLWAGLDDVDRARSVLPAMETLSEEDALDARNVLLRIEIAEGRVPPDEDLALSPYVALTAAGVLLANQHDAARASRLALGALTASNAGPLVHAEALRILIAALVETTLEHPPSLVAIPEEVRSKVVQAIESRLPEVLSTPLPASTLNPLRSAWKTLLQLADDTDALSTLKETGATDRDETEEERARRAALQAAERLAREGHIEAAFQMFPPDEHPWRSRLYRVDVLRLARQPDRALEEVLRLSDELPGRARTEMKAAHLLAEAGRLTDALRHAQEGCNALPARGLRVLVAECLLALGRGDEAWEMLPEMSRRLGDASFERLPLRPTKRIPTARSISGKSTWRRIRATSPPWFASRSYSSSGTNPSNRPRWRGRRSRPTRTSWQWTNFIVSGRCRALRCRKPSNGAASRSSPPRCGGGSRESERGAGAPRAAHAGRCPRRRRRAHRLCAPPERGLRESHDDARDVWLDARAEPGYGLCAAARQAGELAHRPVLRRRHASRGRASRDRAPFSIGSGSRSRSRRRWA